MILAEAPSLPTPDPDVAVVGKHVDCRRRKRVFESPKTGNVRTAETFVAMRRSVRFSTASDDPELREPSVAKPVATTSSPFVKNSNVRRNTRMRPSKLVVGGEPGHSDEVWIKNNRFPLKSCFFFVPVGISLRVFTCVFIFSPALLASLSYLLPGRFELYTSNSSFSLNLKNRISSLSCTRAMHSRFCVIL